MNCPNCNYPLNPGESFCGYCGTPVAQSQQTTQSVQQEWQQPVHQQGWQPQQPAEQYQPQQRYQQPQQQYQQPQQFQSQPQQYHPYQYMEPIPPKKSKTPIIVAIIVVAVLVTAGICAAIFLPKIFNSNNNTSSSTTAVEHRYLGSDGTVIVEDNDFNANDSATEAKLKAALNKEGDLQSVVDMLNSQLGDMGSMEILIKGNAVVYELKYNMTMTDEMIEQMKPAMESVSEMLQSMMTGVVDMMRKEVGADSLVMIVVYKDQNDKLILGKVLK